MPKYSHSITNPFGELNSPQIELYYVLKSLPQPVKLTNKKLSLITAVAPETISRQVKRLCGAGLVELHYTSGRGTQRTIEVKELPDVK